MNLLEATSTLIDFVKTNAPEDDKTIERAVKRMEKRLDVLQLRAAKALRKRRSSGWFWCRTIIKATCHKCGYKLNFGSFVKNAVICGRGHIKSLHCPKCGLFIQGQYRREELE